MSSASRCGPGQEGGPRRLEGRTALVTGAGTGIGASIARRLSDEGARTLLVGLEEDELERVAAALPAGTARSHVTDVADSEAVPAAVAAAVDLGGGLDIVVNNAGVGFDGGIEDCEVREWHQTLDVNLTGPMLVIRHALPHLRRSAAASVVNIASVAGRRAFPGQAAYCASKAALIMLTQQAAIDYGSDGIRFNAICPGWVATPMSERDMEYIVGRYGGTVGEAFTRVSSCTPLGRVADPSEIAAVTAFLCSPDASFLTGAVIAADGGSTLLDVSTIAFDD